MPPADATQGHAMHTLDHKLRQVIDQLASSTRLSKLISINAALIAEQLQHGGTRDTSALKVVAGEIQRLSDESAGGLTTLHNVLGEVKLLTQTINLAGRQRMLSQKIMKLHLLQRTEHATPARAAELTALVDELQRTLAGLQQSPLNTPEIDAQLARAVQAAQRFIRALPGIDLLACSELNEHLLRELHLAVQRYEELAGGTAIDLAPSGSVAAPLPTSAPSTDRASTGTAYSLIRSSSAIASTVDGSARRTGAMLSATRTARPAARTMFSSSDRS